MISRDESQQKFIDLWIKNNYYGTLTAITSWGKTTCSIKAAIQCRAESIIVIVPTKELQKQWQLSLKSWKVKNYIVYVVNTAVNKEINCDLLIIDEAHSTASADWFSLSWKNAKFNKIIALSATMIRNDNKHKVILEVAPILMTVTFEEALENNWISNYTIYNIALEFTIEEREVYNHIEYNLNKIFRDVSEIEKLDLEYVEKNMFNLSSKYISQYKKTKDNKELYLLAISYNRLIGYRKKLIYNAQAKKDKTLWFLKDSKLNKEQTIVFSQTQEFADYIYENFKSETEVIHSGMKDKDRELALKRFKDKHTKKRILSTVKAFNEGIDIPQLKVAINASYTSSKRESIQKLGRIGRLFGDNNVIFINLYIKDSQEVYWLRNSQYGLFKDKIKWLN